MRLGACTAVFAVALAQLTLGQDVNQATASRELSVTVGKSVLVDSPQVIERIAVANGDLAEAVAISPREILVNGKGAGETSMIVWQQGGNRLFFDVTVMRNESHIDDVRRELVQEMGNQNVTMDVEGDTVFLRGTVPDLTAANRAVTIAGTLGKTVNLLKVAIPGSDQQILIKVRFADVDRSATQQLGLNLVSTGATNTIGTVSTGQFGAPGIQTANATGAGTQTRPNITLSQALQIFLFRPDLNLGATIEDLATRNLLQILAEPNVLAIDGHQASFLAGGEFPYPNLQGGGAGLGAVTVSFREFGVRINFTPIITPRGTIRLEVQPEVSSLDFANALVVNGATIPAMSTRRISTGIELEDGQTFAIGGLLDNRDTETFNRIPGLADIPLLGKLFQSRSITKSNSELLVLVTPEIVRPIAKNQPIPDLKRPGSFLPPNTSSTPPQQPGKDVTGEVPLTTNPPPAIPIEDLIKANQKANPPQQTQSSPALQFIPMLTPTQGAPSTTQPVPQPAPAPQGQSQ